MKLYEALAAEVEKSIRAGLLIAGDRLPSVRHTCKTRAMSASTVFQAYYLLEARGLIRARERAGYFVSRAPVSKVPEPQQPSRPRDESTPVDVSELVFEFLAATRQRSATALGSPFPSPLLFPAERLGRSLSAATKRLDPWSSVDGLSPGAEALRRQISLRYLADGMAIGPDEIVVTNGALEALNLCLATVTRPGDAVVVECPTFYGALQALERMGLRAIQVPTHPREGVDLTALEHAIERHQPKACWVMTNFQNPLGSLMPVDRKKQLVELLARHQLPMIEDDVYGELFFGAARPPPAKAFDKEGLVMHCSSFSKSLAPGYRIGWAAPGRFTSAVARQKLTFSLSASVPAQLALAHYLKRGAFDKHLRRLRTTLAAQQAALVAALGRYFPGGTMATRPAGGYFLWVEMPRHVDALQIHREAVAQKICAAPGHMFSASRDFQHCLRLNYGHPWDTRMEQAVETLGKLVRRNAGRH